jgi:CRISPR-associated protein Csm5
MLFTGWHNGARPNFERLEGDRLPRRPGEESEQQALGGPGVSFMKAIAVADSNPVPVSAFKLYLLRVSTLQARRGTPGYDLGWKQAPRGAVSGMKPEESTPLFAEMAAPGTVFEGNWRENAFFAQPEIARMLRWRQPMTGARLLAAANDYAAQLIAIHKQYGAWTGLTALGRSLDAIEARLNEARSAGNACVVSMGWGSGLLAKTGWLETEDQAYRNVLKQVPLYARAIESGLPFPKTRRILFLGNQPAALPGWAVLEIG